MQEWGAKAKTWMNPQIKYEQRIRFQFIVQLFPGAGQPLQGTEKSMCVFVILQRECIECYGMAIHLFFKPNLWTDCTEICLKIVIIYLQAGNTDFVSTPKLD